MSVQTIKYTRLTEQTDYEAVLETCSLFRRTLAQNLIVAFDVHIYLVMIFSFYM